MAISIKENGRFYSFLYYNFFFKRHYLVEIDVATESVQLVGLNIV